MNKFRGSSFEVSAGGGGGGGGGLRIRDLGIGVAHDDRGHCLCLLMVCIVIRIKKIIRIRMLAIKKSSMVVCGFTDDSRQALVCSLPGLWRTCLGRRGKIDWLQLSEDKTLNPKP